MHRLLALRARLRGGAGHLRADDRGPRLRVPRRGRHVGKLHRFRMRVLRRLRAGLPDRRAAREVGAGDGPADAFGGHDLRLLRRRLLVQGGDARRRGRAHGAVQGRQGQSRPFLRQGALRLGLRHPQGPHPQSDDPRKDHRPVARGDLGRGVRACRQRVPPHPVPVRPRRDRRHHLVALHQRGDLSRPEAGAAGLRQQQCRHLRARLPFADRLRPEDHLRHLGRHAGFQLGRADRRGHDHRRQPDRRPSGVRLAAEEAAAARREADRRRSAPHRHRALGACRGRLSSAAEARHQCRRGDVAVARHRHRRAVRREVHPRALRLVGVRGLGGLRRRTAAQPGGGREAVRRAGRADPRRRRGSMPPAATARSITASASPSTARARPR